MPKVSVIVPVYNVEKYILRCMETLANQTLKDIEIILINDGSTDNSKRIIKKYIEKNKITNFIYLEKPNGGLSDARNYGLKRATGEYIAFLDSDDFVDETIYEKMYKKAKQGNLDYVECDFYWSYPAKREKKTINHKRYIDFLNEINSSEEVDKTDNKNARIKTKLKDKIHSINIEEKYNIDKNLVNSKIKKKENEITTIQRKQLDFITQLYASDFKNKIDIGYRYKNKYEMLETGRVVAWNKLIKKSIINNNFSVGKHYEDVDFFYKLLLDIETFGIIEEPLLYYVQREGSITNKQGLQTKDIFDVLENVLNYYIVNGYYHKYKVELEYTYSRILLCSSLKRIAKIKDKKTREKLVKKTWDELNLKFPNWRENVILLNSKSNKSKYMKSIKNYKTLRLYTKFLKFM